MQRRFLLHPVALVSVLAADVPWFPANAQGGGAGVTRVPCCRCVDGIERSISLDTGTASWRVRRPNTSLSEVAVVVASPNGSWANVTPARWIAPSGSPQAGGGYPYDFQFELSTCSIPARVSLAGRFAADNWAAVLLDGQLVARSTGPPNNGFTQQFVTPFSATVSTPGVHVLRITVRNDDFVTGMVLQGAITVQCPRDPAAF